MGTNKDDLMMTLLDEIDGDIEGLEINWEHCESTNQLTEIDSNHIDSQLFVLRKIKNRIEELLGMQQQHNSHENGEVVPCPEQ